MSLPQRSANQNHFSNEDKSYDCDVFLAYVVDTKGKLNQGQMKNYKAVFDIVNNYSLRAFFIYSCGRL